jgi:hypothetical protein
MIEPEKTKKYWGSWLERAYDPYLSRVVVVNGGKLNREQLSPLVYQTGAEPQRGTFLYSNEIMGPVPAFAWGVEAALKTEADLIACFHDDLEILESGWDREVIRFFDDHPRCMLAGFGGAPKLGRPGMYDQQYDPMSLARHGFVSNMRDAEAHGIRSDRAQRLAVLDGFSLIGRRRFMNDFWFVAAEQLGLTHHAYDALAGVVAAALHGEVWLIPLQVHHAGGASAVGNQDYQLWARQQNQGRGDQGFWEDSHRKVWEYARGVLPLGW